MEQNRNLVKGKGLYFDDDKIKVNQDKLILIKSLINKKRVLDTQFLQTGTKWEEIKTTIREILKEYRAIHVTSNNLIAALNQVIERVPLRSATSTFLFHVAEMEKLNKRIKLLHALYRKEICATSVKEYKALLKEERKLKKKLRRQVHAVNNAYKSLEFLAAELQAGRPPMKTGGIIVLGLILPWMHDLYGVIVAMSAEIPKVTKGYSLVKSFFRR